MTVVGFPGRKFTQADATSTYHVIGEFPNGIA